MHNISLSLPILLPLLFRKPQPLLLTQSPPALLLKRVNPQGGCNFNMNSQALCLLATPLGCLGTFGITMATAGISLGMSPLSRESRKLGVWVLGGTLFSFPNSDCRYNLYNTVPTTNQINRLQHQENIRNSSKQCLDHPEK
ncbi:hypothetical protein XENTR_v10006228 [Xenopus tropicalis]|nr:hypothetical protein XENTR_v10006228 [Xenopus tropicalis]